ncbi:MAG TPA: SBBP repeat-containing protein, partial [candidate division Zixibacteria bacterium]|nr:SBBP repeat-containing protein [candidate division Zixibacteria bacterium]
MNTAHVRPNLSMARFVVQVWCTLTIIQGGALSILGGTRSDLLKQSKTAVMSSLIKSPLVFERNEGQTNPKVKFISRGRGSALALTSNQVLVLFHDSTPIVRADERLSRFDREDPRRCERGAETLLRIEFLGADSTRGVRGVGELVGKRNYFIGNDQSKWRSRVATYSQVRYESIYDGIDLLFYGNQQQLEFDYVVSPGADLNSIVLSFEGANDLEIEDDSNLLVRTGCGRLRLRAPIVYQKAGTEKEMIPGRYVMKGENKVGFKIATYDHSRVLIIDPVLEYSTYLGGSWDDAVRGVALDDEGNIYVTGETSSPDFPTENAVQDTRSGSRRDVFVTKLNPTGSAIIYSTYLGGFFSDTGHDIAVDAMGNAYITGSTDSNNYPLLNPIQAEYRGADAFVTKLNSTGDSLVFSTYLGGSDFDSGNAIAVDSSGRAHIGGDTSSTDFPVANPVQAVFGGAFSDGFVTKLNADGSTFIYSTYLGGSGGSRQGGDPVNDIAVDSSGNAYVTGFTTSTDFPTANPIWEGDEESNDAFV